MRAKHWFHERWRLFAALALGVVLGTLLVAPPASAHFVASIKHIWKHIRPLADARYANAVSGTDKARNANKLDGLDSAAFKTTSKQAFRQANLDLSNDDAAPTTIASLTLSGPANYLVTGTGMVFSTGPADQAAIDLALNGSELGGFPNTIGFSSASQPLNYALIRVVRVSGSSATLALRGYRILGSGTVTAMVSSLTATRVSAASGQQP